MDKNKIYLGINWQCNSSAALMINGKIMGCISEERFSRVKNDERYPKKAIDWLLKEFKVKTNEIDKVCYISKVWSPTFIMFRHYTNFNITDYVSEQKKYWYKKIYEKKNISLLNIFKNKIDFNQYPGRRYWIKIYNSLKNIDSHISNKNLISYGKQIRCEVASKHLKINKNKICFVDHSSGHAAWAFYSNKDKNKHKYLVLTLDAMGDFINYSINKLSKKNEFERIVIGGNSIIARLYRYTTLIMGFKPDEHEYKLMGMAPYAKKKYFSNLLEKFRNFQIIKDLKFKNKKMPKDLYFDVKNFFEAERFDNICGALQKYTEELTSEWVTNISKRLKFNNIMLVGGVAMNVKNNLQLSKLKKIKNIFVPLSPDDSSLSMGAIYYYNSIINKNISYPIKNAYLGPKINFNFNVNKLAKNYSIKTKNINSIASHLLSEGKIIGRVVGRAEFGARALGNRSILADPSNIESVKKINETIKNRDFWMPFAASVLERKANKYFYLNDNILNYEYMTKCLDTTIEGQKKLKSAVHPYDKTCRPQIIKKNSNKDYEDLIFKFGKITNIYALLNTSFNLHGYPIVNDIKETLYIFKNSNLEALIINNEILIKK
ncbi:hypothetical protein AKH21_01830 [Pelagibacteraceae bacterium GOM-A5]|nr:hypothetical protein AKH21_01830 [Pelagibacteraceae bacterium GOM-A5]